MGLGGYLVTAVLISGAVGLLASAVGLAEDRVSQLAASVMSVLAGIPLAWFGLWLTRRQDPEE